MMRRYSCFRLDAARAALHFQKDAGDVQTGAELLDHPGGSGVGLEGRPGRDRAGLGELLEHDERVDQRTSLAAVLRRRMVAASAWSLATGASPRLTKSCIACT